MPEYKVPEVWYKAQRVIRSVVQFLVVAVPILNLLLVAAVNYLQEQTDVVVPAVVFVWLNAAIAFSAFLIGLVVRLMAVPGVNDWLVKIGLGSVPKQALTTVRDANTGAVEATIVQPDPKAHISPE